MIRKIAPYFGMIGVSLFTACFLLNGWFRTDDYNWVHNYVSDLSYFPHGWVQVVNFLIIGIGLFIFAVGTWQTKISKAGSILLLIIAVFYFLSGPFVTDPMGTAAADMSVHGMVHGILGAAVFSLSPITALIFGLKFRKNHTHRKFAIWSFAAFAVMLITVIFMKIAQPMDSRLNFCVGLIQRFSLLTFYAWIFSFAWILRKKEAT